MRGDGRHRQAATFQAKRPRRGVDTAVQAAVECVLHGVRVGGGSPGLDIVFSFVEDP